MWLYFSSPFYITETLRLSRRCDRKCLFSLDLKILRLYDGGVMKVVGNFNASTFSQGNTTGRGPFF